MAKFETVPLAELKTRIPGKLLPLVEEYKGYFEKLREDLGGKLVLEKGDDPKDIKKALKAAAASVNKAVRFPYRGEEDAVSFYLEEQTARRRRGRPPKAEAGVAVPKPTRKRRSKKAGG